MKIYKNPAFVCGFAAAALNVIPFLKGCACCLIVPAASILSLFFYTRLKSNEDNSYSNTPLTYKKGLIYGLLTGLTAAFFATIFDIAITFITHSNEIIESLPDSQQFFAQNNLEQYVKASMDLFKQIAGEIKYSGFSLLYSLMMFFYYFFSFTVFGIIGGLIGVSIINDKIKRSQVQ